MNNQTQMQILVVDDNPANLELIRQVLQEAGYHNMMDVRDSETVPKLVSSLRPDLLILDLHMPRLSGFEILGEIRPHLQADNLPVLVVTADATPAAAHRALALGAKDFLTKPLDVPSLLLRVNNLLHMRALEQNLREHGHSLERDVQTRTHELEQSRTENLLVLTRLAEYHDDQTGQHTHRVGATAAMIAAALGLSEADVSLLRDAAPLHDIGKIGISQDILHKPGELSPVERTEMMRHVEIGADILSGTYSPVLRAATEIILYHHERWDGTGYLRGLKEAQIPLNARITAVADVFDALTHDRPYKPAWDADHAVAEVTAGAGTAFDPKVIEAFIAVGPDTLTEPLLTHL